LRNPSVAPTDTL